MDAVEFLKQYSRMVASGVQPFAVPSELPYEEIVAHVEQWAKEHPAKTRQSEFLKMFPNARIDNGVIFLGPCAIDRVEYDSYKCTMNCKKCCRDYWLKEIE